MKEIFMCHDKNRICPHSCEHCCCECEDKDKCYALCEDAENYRWMCDHYEVQLGD